MWLDVKSVTWAGDLWIENISLLDVPWHVLFPPENSFRSLGSMRYIFSFFFFNSTVYKIRTSGLLGIIHQVQYQMLIYHQLAGSFREAMAPHSSTLAWKIPWTEESGRLQSMGSLRVGHDWATSLSLFTFVHWRRKWQPTPVFLPGESQGWGSLVGCHLWGHTESDTPEAT